MKPKGPVCYEGWALLAMVVLAAALRAAALPASPLTFDELSALNRVGYDSLPDLIAGGVRNDGHPAGVQLFLWLWCRLVGTGSVVVRLPFVVMGTAAVALVYDAGRSWWNHRAALLAALLVATSQQAVYYSCLARPYAAGLFALTLALAAWSRIVMRRQQSWHHYALLALGLAMCAYSHYYCALVAAMTAIAGLIIIAIEGEPKTLWRYLAACLAAVATFVPHLPLTLHQMFDLQGLKWLGKPTPEWLLQYVRYLCHFSWAVPAALVAAVALMWGLGPRSGRRMALAASLWLLPIAVGYAYSTLVSPTLQTSVTLFALPFVPLAIGGMVGAESRWPRAALALATVAVAMTATLIWNREHYKVSRESYLQRSVEAVVAAGSEQTLSLIALRPDHLAYYGDVVGSSLSDFIRPQYDLNPSLYPLVVCSGLDERQLRAVRKHYPYLLERRECTTTDILTLSRDPRPDTASWGTRLLTRGEVSGWEDGCPWLPLFEARLDSLTTSRFVELHAALQVATVSEASNDVRLALQLLRGDKTVDWRESSAAEQSFATSDSTAIVEVAHLLQLNVKRRSALKRYRLRVVLFCPDGAEAGARPLGYSLDLRPAGRYMYALDEEL